MALLSFTCKYGLSQTAIELTCYRLCLIIRCQPFQIYQAFRWMTIPATIVRTEKRLLRDDS